MRSFFCLEIPENVQAEMAQLPDGIHQPAKVKWVKSANLHITLKFLGDVNSSTLSKVKEEARLTADQHSSFSIVIDKLGCFPNTDYPKVIWLGSTSSPKRIHRIHDELEARMEPLGFSKENRDYIPHVTLGRTKDKDSGRIKEFGSEIKKFGLKDSWTIEVGRLTLMKSELRSSGPVYSKISQFELSGA